MVFLHLCVKNRNGVGGISFTGGISFSVLENDSQRMKICFPNSSIFIRRNGKDFCFFY
jgi:hypothetical protein